jgi:hypothetical protein
MRSGSEEGSYLRLVDFYITQLQAESNKEEEEKRKKVYGQGSRWEAYKDVAEREHCHREHCL